MKTHRVGSGERFRNLYNKFASPLRLEWEWFMKNWTDFLSTLTLAQIDVGAFLSESFPVVEKNEDFMFLTTSNKTRFVVNSVVYDFVNWSKTSTVLGLVPKVRRNLFVQKPFLWLFMNKSSIWIQKAMQIGKQNHLDGFFSDVTWKPRPLSR